MANPKIIKSGEQWFYLKLVLDSLMAQTPTGHTTLTIGKDNGYVDGWKYWRRWELLKQERDGQTDYLLAEQKNSKHMAVFTRVYRIYGMEHTRPSFELIEDWNH